ncbi:hypothetical protein GOBAR_DD19714 [Gossypium barbadense]|nr:hypothetical protein GOBAR_DD19714 [Gossypium barbadense]
MSSFAPFLLILSSLALVSIGRCEERAPHGIAYESPMAFSPSAYDFFHPKTPCVASTCSPLPVAAQVDGSKALASKVSSGHGVGAAKCHHCQLKRCDKITRFTVKAYAPW